MVGQTALTDDGRLLCEGFRARQGLAQHFPNNRKTSFAFACITRLTGLHLRMLWHGNFWAEPRRLITPLSAGAHKHLLSLSENP